MSVHFDQERMQQVLLRHTAWWKGELKEPLMAVTIHNAYPLEKKPKAPLLSQRNCTELQWTPEEIIDTLDAHLSTQEYLGDAYPRVNFDAFGPGVVAAFCGARLDNSSGNVWFFPEEEKEIADIHAHYDPDNVWAQRIKALYRAGLERWGKTVVMGMPDLGGVMDIAAHLRGSQNLLMDLYDEPEEVIRLCGEVETAWREAYRDFSSVLHPQSAGYTDFSGLLSAEPSYIVQCDFCYMISNEMFRQFVLPTLERDLKWLGNVIYHLDGVGELKHLDTLLQMEDLKAIQWVFGDGQPGPMHWLDVYRKIKAAGKRMMLLGSPEEMLEPIRLLGGDGIYCCLGLTPGNDDLVRRLLAAR